MKMKFFTCICFVKIFVFMSVQNVLCYNVLVVFPEPTKSHGILGDGYVKHLLKAGHNVSIFRG